MERYRSCRAESLLLLISGTMTNSYDQIMTLTTHTRKETIHSFEPERRKFSNPRRLSVSSCYRAIFLEKLVCLQLA